MVESSVPEIVEQPITSLISGKERLVLLLGGAGSGKSTSLLRMIYMLCEKIEASESPTPIPVIFRAEELTSPAETLLDAVFTRMQEIGGTRKAPIGSRELSEGLLYVFVDALDELPNREVQKAIVSRLLEFSKVYPKCKILVASRPHYTVEDIPGLAYFAEFNIAAMTYKEGQRILQRLHKPESLSVPKASEFLRQLQEVHGLELNPLIITVFAASCELSRSDIPANITELFKKFTELMLGRWDESKGLAAQYQSPLKDFVLTRVAYEMHSRRVTSLPLVEFKEVIGKELRSRGQKANSEMLTDEILNRSGLFRITQEKVEFRHLMLQEFFAGRGLPSGGVVPALITDEWWRRALVFYFGDRPNEGNALKKICDDLETAQKGRGLVAAITLGLAVQASYLVETATKLPLVFWIFRKLAAVAEQFDDEVVKRAARPLEKFVDLVLTAREGVAFSFLKDNRKVIRHEVVDEDGQSKEMTERRQFWFIIGLIESGDLEGALDELKSFKPKDSRLYLGLHLGAFLINQRRVTTAAERGLAKKICDELSEKIVELRKQLIDELRSELLEWQKGRVAALEQSSESASRSAKV